MSTAQKFLEKLSWYYKLVGKALRRPPESSDEHRFMFMEKYIDENSKNPYL